MFHTLCFQTVYILDFLSAKVGFPLYIPAIINIFSLLGKDRPQCSNGENSNTPPSWWNKPARKSEGEKTLDSCQILEKEIRKSGSIIPSFHRSKSTTDGSKITTYSETWVPFIGKIINCTLFTYLTMIPLVILNITVKNYYLALYFIIMK